MSNGWQARTVFDNIVASALGAIAAVVLFAMMVLTCVDVVGRYFFAHPVIGAFEITEMLLAALIFAGLPITTLRNEHVTVDVFDSITPDWLFRLQHVFACTVGLLSTGYLAWRLWIRAENMYASGETTAQLKFRLGYLAFAMSVLMALSALALLVLAFRPPRRSTPGEGSGP